MTFHAPAEATFGQWLRQRRRELDLTREQLARQVGCSTITVRKLETEERRPSPAMTERLAQLFQIAPDDRPAFLSFARGNPFAAPALPAAGAPRHNLPAQLTSFIGREYELNEIARLLGTARLVTLTGPGGSGKTRLALQATSAQLEHYSDGVCWVELAPLAEPALLRQTVARALGVRERPGQTLAERLAEHLRTRQLLLLLDNGEHLIHACAELADDLLRACPRLTILTTSRESLAVPGERVFSVPALSLPASDADTDLAELEQSDAVRLFCERARAALPTFELSAANAAAVGQICWRLDGIPLAIELAASRVKLLRVQEILGRLDDRFGLLISGSRAAPPRHQTLQGLIDWSYDLLAEPERRLLRRLAVFAGGWTLEAAEAVCAGDDLPASRVLDLLTLLVDKNLVVAVRQPGSETRYHLLETIREYAWARLEASGEATAVQRKHARCFCSLAETWNALLSTKDQPSALAHFETELDNFRAALLGIRDDADPEFGPHLVDMFWRYLYIRGNWSEARMWLETALALTGVAELEHTETRARTLGALGAMLNFQNEYTTGESYLTQSLLISQDRGYTWWHALVLNLLGSGRRERGDTITARQLIQESAALFRELGDTHWLISTLNTLAEVAVYDGDPGRARSIVGEAISLNQKLGSLEQTGWSLNCLGHVAQLEGDFAQATKLHLASLNHFRELKLQPGLAAGQQCLGETALAQKNSSLAKTYLEQALTLFGSLSDWTGISRCLDGLAGAAALDEEPDRAARVWGAAEALRRSTGTLPAPAARATQERLQAAARQHLGDAAFDAAWAAGSTMTAEQAIELALQTSAAG